MKQPAIYIVANKRNGTLYTGGPPISCSASISIASG
jgi:hypothetical protein